ncbi:MAG: hypothetical protein LBM41_07160 [Ruminococcus sp.]|jgi:hypothetical protein|nr:hypothetical protein [Ruminococcus sp.]
MKKSRLFTGLGLAAMMTFAVAFTACDSETKPAMTELIPNVITQSQSGTDTEVPAPATDINGSTYVTADTKTPEELASIVSDMMTAGTTAPAAVLDTSGNSANGTIRSYEDKYAYNTLNDTEKALYAHIVDKIQTLGIRVDPEYREVDEETWDRIYCMVYNQEPQLFWMSPKLDMHGRIYYRSLDREAIKSMQDQIDTTVNKLLSDMNGMTDFQKLDYINTYLSVNSTFLLGADSADEANYNSTIYNAFAGGTSKQGDIQCVGYAHAVQYLCDRIGINSMVITGVTDKGASHAWNILDLNGDWYNYDVTWDDPVLDTPNYKNVRHMYMLVPDSWILDRTHFSQNLKFYVDGSSFKYFDAPVCTATEMNWYKQSGKVYSDKDSAVAELKKQLDNAAANGLRTTEIMLSDKSVYDAVHAEMKNLQTELKANHSNVKGLSDKSAEVMLVIELDVIYN